MRRLDLWNGWQIICFTEVKGLTGVPLARMLILSAGLCCILNGCPDRLRTVDLLHPATGDYSSEFIVHRKSATVTIDAESWWVALSSHQLDLFFVVECPSDSCTVERDASRVSVLWSGHLLDTAPENLHWSQHDISANKVGMVMSFDIRARNDWIDSVINSGHDFAELQILLDSAIIVDGLPLAVGRIIGRETIPTKIIYRLRHPEQR